MSMTTRPIEGPNSAVSGLQDARQAGSSEKLQQPVTERGGMRPAQTSKRESSACSTSTLLNVYRRTFPQPELA